MVDSVIFFKKNKICNWDDFLKYQNRSP
jgi:hypothetical protein